ncbi:MAG: (deoxy)nucleoside triphosphate pyrophosphohydrolase [Akkermansia sp.]|nr:(deoxy)nucleoside triphosphate pyrophosphohydrolase [Akkermansia sp.]
MSEAAPRKTLDVVAALIIDAAGRVLATQCPATKHDGGWEFPGGKMEPGESMQAALTREIREELSLHIEAGELLYTVVSDYPAYRVKLHCLVCRILDGTLTLHEHVAARWLAVDELNSVAWLPADEELLPILRKYMQSRA